MSRSGYTDGCDFDWHWIMYRGAVSSAIRGKRGQRLLQYMAEALDAMPVKRLIANSLQADGEFCALGAVAHHKGIDVAGLDPEDYDAVAEKFDIAPSLSREIVFTNDEDCYYNRTPEQRWRWVRDWVQGNLTPIERSE